MPVRAILLPEDWKFENSASQVCSTENFLFPLRDNHFESVAALRLMGIMRKMLTFDESSLMFFLRRKFAWNE